MICRSLFVLFLLAIVLSVLLRFTDSDNLFGILKLFLRRATMQLLMVNKVLVLNNIRQTSTSNTFLLCTTLWLLYSEKPTLLLIVLFVNRKKFC